MIFSNVILSPSKFVYFNGNLHCCKGRRHDITCSRRKCYDVMCGHNIIYDDVILRITVTSYDKKKKKIEKQSAKLPIMQRVKPTVLYILHLHDHISSSMSCVAFRALNIGQF